MSLMNKTTSMHLIEGDTILNRLPVSTIPRVGEEVRLGGKGEERFYRVTRVVHAFDEFSVYDRVNVGLERIR